MFVSDLFFEFGWTIRTGEEGDSVSNPFWFDVKTVGMHLRTTNKAVIVIFCLSAATDENVLRREKMLFHTPLMCLEGIKINDITQDFFCTHVVSNGQGKD